MGIEYVTHASAKTILQMVLENFEDRMVQVLLVAVVLRFLFAFFESDPKTGSLPSSNPGSPSCPWC
jgi:hypothetical protein